MSEVKSTITVRIPFLRWTARADLEIQIPDDTEERFRLRAGQIDGSTYKGDCACLAGTIANARGVNYEALGFADSNRPIERWFLGVRKGDTPESNPIAKITEDWIVEFLALTGQAALAEKEGHRNVG